MLNPAAFLSSTSASFPPETSSQPRKAARVQHEDKLQPVTRSRRASQDDPHNTNEQRLLTDTPQSLRSAESEFISQEAHNARHDAVTAWVESLASPPHIHNVSLIAVDELELPHANGELPKHGRHHTPHLGAQPSKTIHFEQSGREKCMQFPANALIAKSLFFRRMFENDPELDNFTLGDADARAIEMLLHWLLYGKLNKPTDFHSLTHCFTLYALAVRFEMEDLQNCVMDTIRAYYRDEDQTAPAFRLEYVYRYTGYDDPLRSFTISTAANRSLQTSSVSDSMQEIIAKGGDLAVDFSVALMKQATNQEADVRAGSDCDWHQHQHTPPCPLQDQQPNLLDGA